MIFVKRQGGEMLVPDSKVLPWDIVLAVFGNSGMASWALHEEVQRHPLLSYHQRCEWFTGTDGVEFCFVVEGRDTVYIPSQNGLVVPRNGVLGAVYKYDPIFRELTPFYYASGFIPKG